MRSRLLIDERSKVRADGLPTLPVTDTQGALGVLREAIETFTPSLVVDLLPKSKEPARRRGFRESDAVARGWIKLIYSVVRLIVVKIAKKTVCLNSHRNTMNTVDLDQRVSSNELGTLLRYWREVRGTSQLDLALGSGNFAAAYQFH